MEWGFLSVGEAVVLGKSAKVDIKNSDRLLVAARRLST